MTNKYKQPLGPLQEGWVQDLLDNKELQGTLYLASVSEEGKTKYCCLGRACVSLGLKSTMSDGFFFFGREERKASLPTEAVYQLKMNEADGRFDTPFSWEGNLYTDLVNLNDDFCPWEVIAEVIRKRADEIFYEAA